MSLLRSEAFRPNGKGIGGQSSATYVRATCLPADELEPCLRGAPQLHVGPQTALNRSLVSTGPQLSPLPHRKSIKKHRRVPLAYTNSMQSGRVKKRDCMGKCVMCLLIQAVFIFGIFLAFLIGHLASDVEFTNDTTYLLAGTINKDLQLTPLINLTASSAEEVDKSPPKPTNSPIIQQLNIWSPTNLTIRDVYPPDGIGESHRHWTHKSGRFPKKQKFTSLPNHLYPIHYELELDMTEFAAAEHIFGRADITLESFGNGTVNEILFHAASNVFIQRLKLERNNKIVVVGTALREEHDLVRVSVGEALLPHAHYHLIVEFRSRICLSPTEAEGTQCIARRTRGKGGVLQRQIIAFTTKFEPSFAKTFIPCWDEPRWRSSFNITVKHPIQFTVLSNTSPLFKPKLIRANTGLTRFKETPKLPVYLLAFVVAELNQLELRTARDLPLNIWTLHDHVLASHFAAHFAPVIFDRVEKDLEVTYPLGKLDFMLTPSYPVDGMENWGLIVFRENSLLLSTSGADEQNMTVDRIAEQYGVEKIIHQWFGDLVTMFDWEDIWLSEGFTSYFVYDFLNTDHPHLTDNEYYLQLIELLKRQTTDERTALVQTIRTSSDAENLFDPTNLYSKGAVMVKMIKDLLGVEKFRRGVTKFLTKNAYKSVDREALWASFPAFVDHGAEEERLANVVEGWLLNEGMPEIILSRNYDDQTIRITQRQCNENNYVVYLEDSFTASEPSAVPSSASAETQKRESGFGDSTVNPLSSTSLPLKTSTFDDSLFANVPPSDAIPATVRPPRRRKGHRHPHRISTTPSPENTRLPLFRGTERFKAPANESRPTELHVQKAPSKRRRARPSANPLWSIPFSYSFGSIRSSSGQTVRQFWLHNETLRFVDLGVQSYQFILANPHWIYPFKVNYDIDNWKLLVEQLHRDHTEIPVMSRMQLIVDAGTYLKQSGVPQLYVQLLGYLAKEQDLGVLLVGLDAMHDLVEMCSGTSLMGPLLIHLVSVIQQFDRILESTAVNPELAAVWLLSPNRLSKLYQLRCVANLGTCDENRQVQRWMQHPTAIDADQHQSVTALCHFLFTQAGPSELALMIGLLKQPSTQWTVNIQLATCVRDEALLETVVDTIVSTRNAAVYISVLQNSYSIQYNRKFREFFWHGIGRLSLHERQVLFAVNTGKHDRVARLLLHSVRTVEELDVVEALLNEWPPQLRLHLTAIRRKLDWLQNVAVRQIHRFLIEEVD